MNKVLIITGGRIEAGFVKNVCAEFLPKTIIVADRGMMVAKEAELIPDYIVGDFDSGESEVLSYFRSLFPEHGKPVIRSFQPEKDETDTELAISTALLLAPSEILILGATGTRLDHVMANVGLLLKMTACGVKAKIADEYNLISLHDTNFTMKKEDSPHPFFSLLPFGGEVKDLSIKGAKYELDRYLLKPGSSICISNEFKNKTVKISFSEGMLLLFRSGDEPVSHLV